MKVARSAIVRVIEAFVSIDANRMKGHLAQEENFKSLDPSQTEIYRADDEEATDIFANADLAPRSLELTPITTERANESRSHATHCNSGSGCLGRIRGAVIAWSPQLCPVHWGFDATYTKFYQRILEESATCSETSLAQTEHRLRNKEWVYNLQVLRRRRWVLDAQQLLLARTRGIIDTLPRIPSERIQDLDNSDSFVKLLAIIQITWHFAQLAVRLSRGLPIAHLEVVTMGFASCSVVTYALLSERPKDVRTILEIKAVRPATLEELERISEAGPEAYVFRRRGPAIPNNSIYHRIKGSWNSLEFGLGHLSAFIVLGAIHCIAWNFSFPTTLDQGLWRVSAIAMVATMPFAILFSLLCQHFHLHTLFGKSWEWTDRLELVLVLTAGVVYVVARAVSGVEAVRLLAYQPPETFSTTWAAGFPHFG